MNHNYIGLDHFQYLMSIALFGLLLSGVVLIGISWAAPQRKMLPNMFYTLHIIGIIMSGGAIAIFVGLTIYYAQRTCCAISR